MVLRLACARFHPSSPGGARSCAAGDRPAWARHAMYPRRPRRVALWGIGPAREVPAPPSARGAVGRGRVSVSVHVLASGGVDVGLM